MSIDLEQPPYRATVDLLAAVRSDASALVRVTCSQTRTEARGTHDANELERARLARLLLVRATAADLDLVRRLLDAEITARRNDSFQGAGDTLTILSLLLLDHSDGQLADSWRFWLAKRANFDTFAGGYDVEFVFAMHSAAEVRALVAERLPDELETLEAYDVEAIVDGLDAWREALDRRFPRTLDALTPHDLEAWAELFDDRDAMLRLGLQNADNASARARVHRSLGRHREAVAEWRQAVEDASTAWDRAARLRDAIVDAAKVPMPVPDVVAALERQRPEIPCWNEVGLGRMATAACFELAGALDDEAGRAVWRTAERWRRELDSLSLVGLRAGVKAAEKWGSVGELDTLRHLAAAEHERIYGS